MFAVAELAIDIGKMRKLRLKLGLTMEQAAKAAGWKERQQWNNIESGNRADVPISTLGRIAKALGCEPADLLK